LGKFPGKVEKWYTLSIVIDQETKHFLIKELRGWYRVNARDLPWRRTSDPYAIWISEIMLQQTRVETVIPYYQRWMAELPTLLALVSADQDQVLMLWEGLGYYKRALNLHKAARQIADQFAGELPQDIKSLESLPGIGRYTAGAISSIAFDQPAPILDGNIKRLFSRLFDISTPIQASQTVKELWQISEDLLPEHDPGEFNQALMEMGALVCLPKHPNCAACPLKSVCLANQQNLQDLRPVRDGKSPLPHLQVTAAVIEKNGKMLLAKRPAGGLLGGLWEFPGGKQEGNETLPETLIREIDEELAAVIQVGEYLGRYDHAYTHYKITLHAYQCTLVSDQMEMLYHTDLAWVTTTDMDSYPMGKLDRAIAEKIKIKPSQTVNSVK
jgi:A/G-specific adenine glycosylase